MRVLVTGASGFIGKNLTIRLREKGVEYIPYTREMSPDELARAIPNVDFVFHLAGANRPKNDFEFEEVNIGLTQRLCDLIRLRERPLPVIFTSSIQAEKNNPYGHSKRAAEQALEVLGSNTNSPIFLYRLPNVFGKWSRPNYNSAVATFAHNIARNLPIALHDPAATIRLVYIDDVIDSFLSMMNAPSPGIHLPHVNPIHTISVGDLAELMRLFRSSRESLVTERVGEGLTKRLYATYLSFLPPEKFSYSIPTYSDVRGRFVEMLKTKDSGQFSFFTAPPGVTRGGHYHHTKSEKFFVIQGSARFRFIQIATAEKHEFFVDGSSPVIIESIPGWAHDIKNVGENEMIVMLWANEIFDRDRPDTVVHKV